MVDQLTHNASGASPDARPATHVGCTVEPIPQQPVGYPQAGQHPPGHVIELAAHGESARMMAQRPGSGGCCRFTDAACFEARSPIPVHAANSTPSLGYEHPTIERLKHSTFNGLGRELPNEASP